MGSERCCLLEVALPRGTVPFGRPAALCGAAEPGSCFVVRGYRGACPAGGGGWGWGVSCVTGTVGLVLLLQPGPRLSGRGLVPDHVAWAAGLGCEWWPCCGHSGGDQGGVGIFFLFPHLIFSFSLSSRRSSRRPRKCTDRRGKRCVARPAISSPGASEGGPFPERTDRTDSGAPSFTGHREHAVSTAASRVKTGNSSRRLLGQSGIPRAQTVCSSP